MKITDQMIHTEVQGYSVRLPSGFHNALKAQAALEGKTKDQLFLELLLDAAKRRNA